MRIYDSLASIVNFVVSLLEILLIVRLFLKFFGANSNALFVRWIYDTSDPILSPFRGIFPSPAIQDQYILEFSTIFAIIIYALAGFLIVSLIESVTLSLEDRKKRRK